MKDIKADGDKWRSIPFSQIGGPNFVTMLISFSADLQSQHTFNGNPSKLFYRYWQNTYKYFYGTAKDPEQQQNVKKEPIWKTHMI